MYAFRTRHGPADLCFTDRSGGDLALESDPANLARVLDDFAPGAALCDLVQVHGDHVDVVEDRRTGVRPQGDALVTAQPDVVLMVRAADCVPVLFHAADIGAVAATHCGRPGLLAGVVPAHRRRSSARGARRRSTPGSGPTCAAPATRCPRRCRTRSPPPSRQPGRRRRGGRPHSTSVRACGPSSRPRGVRGQRRLAVHARVEPTCYSYRRDGVGRRVGRRAWSGCEASMSGRLARAARRADPGARSGSRGVRRRGPRSRRGPAGRGHQDVPGLRHPPPRRARGHRRRREQAAGAVRQARSSSTRSSPTCQCDGTSSGSSRATRQARSPMRPTWCTRSTGPSCWGRWTARARAARRVAAGQPRPARQRAPRRRGTRGPGRAGGRGRRVRAPCRCAG